MNTIIVKTQAELDALPDSFKDYTIIEIRGGTIYDRIIVKKAWGSSHVEAWGSSHVEAWGSSHVVAWESVVVHVQGYLNIIELGGFAVAFVLSKIKTLRRIGNNTTLVEPTPISTTKEWLDSEGVEEINNLVIIYKRVSYDWKTQDYRPNETLWVVGSILEHSKWNPTQEECGEGKYHACSHPYFCDEFRSLIKDRYIAIEVSIDDLYIWPKAQYPHKVAFRKGKVLFECDRYGKKIEV